MSENLQSTKKLNFGIKYEIKNSTSHDSLYNPLEIRQALQTKCSCPRNDLTHSPVSLKIHLLTLYREY